MTIAKDRTLQTFGAVSHREIPYTGIQSSREIEAATFPAVPSYILLQPRGSLIDFDIYCKTSRESCPLQSMLDLSRYNYQAVLTKPLFSSAIR